MGVGDGSASRGRQPGVHTDGEDGILPGESWPLCLENAQSKGRGEMGAIEPFTAPPAEASSPPVLNTTPHLPQPGLPYMRQGISEELGSTVPQALREKIWKGEFIELGHMLKEGYHTSSDLTLAFDQSNGGFTSALNLDRY